LQAADVFLSRAMTRHLPSYTAPSLTPHSRAALSSPQASTAVSHYARHVSGGTNTRT
jgi:hypothetical protein